jgi:hypothetical protein
MKNEKIDRIVIVTAISYVIFPVILFFMGWLKALPAFALALLFIYFGICIYRGVGRNYTETGNVGYWLVVFVVGAVVVVLSGIGGFAWQNSDFWARNPIYRDLSTYSWPVVYDLSEQSTIVQNLLGSGKTAFAYYFTWWLPPAGLSQLLNLGETARNVVLMVWTYVGILLIIYLINRALGKASYMVLWIFFGFSGMDVVGFLIKNGWFPLVDHIEWWSEYFQYSSNITQIFWVFNQSVPVWILLALLVQLEDNRFVAGVSSLVFAYSPWAAVWMVPIALVGSFYRVKSKKAVFHFANCMVPACMLLVFGTFYMASSGSNEKIMFITRRYPHQAAKILVSYFLFILLEFGILFLIMGKDAWHNRYSWIVLGELLCIPLFSDTDGNTIMRGSIPALFLLMYMVCGFLKQKNRNIRQRCRKWIMIVILGVGMVTPFTEINRSIQLTREYGAFTQEQVYSFGDIQTDDEEFIRKVGNQFMVEDYENTFFFRYLAKDCSL